MAAPEEKKEDKGTENPAMAKAVAAGWSGEDKWRGAIIRSLTYVAS